MGRREKEHVHSSDYRGPPNPKLRKKRSTNHELTAKDGAVMTQGQFREQAPPEARFPHRMTVGAHQRMAELDFDPLEWSVRIARGEALTTDHPFLKHISLWAFKMGEDMINGKPIDWEEELKKLMHEASASLSDSWVPLNLRSDHIKELMGYLYPKLKAVEHSGSVAQHIKIKPLSASEVDLFWSKFNSNY